MLRWPVLTGVILTCLLAAAPQAEGATFEETPCDLPDAGPAVRPRLRCGTVAVPRDHGNPGAGDFRLAVVVIRAATREPRADPVLFLHGGPGSPLTIKAAQITRRESTILAPDRDLILVDQRGVGRSEPALCPGLAARQLQLVAGNPDADSFVRAWHDGYRACRQELDRQGIDPAWFGTNATVADLDLVRRALDVATWNIYGRSYGTTIGIAMMARHPKTLRAAALDSVYPPDPLPRSYGETANDALDALFAAQPGLAATFDATLAALERDPLPIPVRPGLGTGAFILGSRGFATVVGQALYYPSLLAMLPRMIRAAHDRDATALKPLIEHLASGFLDGSRGNQIAVQCRDRPGPHSAASGRVGYFDPLDDICRDWGVAGDPPPIAASPVPSLLLAGGLDPITPPVLARHAASLLGPKAQVVEFPTLAHDIEEFSPCGAGLITRFVRDPDAPLDIGCAAAVPPVKFQ